MGVIFVIEIKSLILVRSIILFDIYILLIISNALLDFSFLNFTSFSCSEALDTSLLKYVNDATLFMSCFFKFSG